jgi:hypothetical protein
MDGEPTARPYAPLSEHGVAIGHGGAARPLPDELQRTRQRAGPSSPARLTSASVAAVFPAISGQLPLNSAESATRSMAVSM